MLSTKALMRVSPLVQVRFNSTSIPQKLTHVPNKYNAKSSAFNMKPQLPDGIFYHPAPSALDPEITPKAFLPDSDPRKNSVVYYPEESVRVGAHVKNMPIISKARTPKNYGLSPEQIEQIQEMRNKGIPRREIRHKFGVSDHFINICSSPNPETVAKYQHKVNKALKRWDERTKIAKLIKLKQEVTWKRDM
ncbi:hypothetical protein OGAPHI_000408 [Ogataea philodendri]|uniref:Uncharacterized protein n=1 Tax=Ogataea philodendri TaxID=1378263 RepID=A0A9P8T9U3_9ASCO|nr:uncharacterized protein OGAPHI_000408 [Ogataea philodendri]KAH3671703.1 hypothetical protein OGAPHI_000408 [Ogataea philodendri]